MRLWLIPMSYVTSSIVCAIVFPRVEQSFLGSYTFRLSISSVQAYISAAASGMMALTAIVFAIAFVVVQFSAVAYSPRVVLRFVKDRALFHTLGIFMASFIYSLWTLVWIDRAGSGTVPLFSVLLVAFLIILSMVLFSHLVERLNDLQITSVLHSIGDSGREVIDKMFAPLDGCPRVEGGTDKRFDWKALGPPSKRLTYVGPPRTVASFDVKRLVRLAQEADWVDRK